MPHKDTATRPLASAKLDQARKGLSSLANLTDYNPQRAEYGPKKAADINKRLQDAYDAENKAKDAYDKPAMPM